VKALVEPGVRDVSNDLACPVPACRLRGNWGNLDNYERMSWAPSSNPASCGANIGSTYKFAMFAANSQMCYFYEDYFSQTTMHHNQHVTYAWNRCVCNLADLTTNFRGHNYWTPYYGDTEHACRSRVGMGDVIYAAYAATHVACYT